MNLLRERVRYGSRAVAVRLRLAGLVRRRPLPKILRSLTPAFAAPTGLRASLPVVDEALSAAEEIVARLPLVPDTCLYRALARYAVLRSAGHPARFVMGIEPRKDDIAGHAWVELDGEPHGETVDPTLVVTYSYPERAEAT